MRIPKCWKWNVQTLETCRYADRDFVNLQSYLKIVCKRQLRWCHCKYGSILPKLNHYSTISQYAVKVRRHTPWSRVRCHGCRFTHSQFHSQFHSRRHSLRITLKYTTLVCMRSSNAWTMKPWQRSEWRLGFYSVFWPAKGWWKSQFIIKSNKDHQLNICIYEVIKDKARGLGRGQADLISQHLCHVLSDSDGDMCPHPPPPPNS